MLTVAIGGDRGRLGLLGMIGCMIGGLTAAAPSRGVAWPSAWDLMCARVRALSAPRDSNELYCMRCGANILLTMTKDKSPLRAERGAPPLVPPRAGWPQKFTKDRKTSLGWNKK